MTLVVVVDSPVIKTDVAVFKVRPAVAVLRVYPQSGPFGCRGKISTVSG